MADSLEQAAKKALVAMENIALDLVCAELTTCQGIYSEHYRPHRLATAEAEVEQVKSAIAALRSALHQEAGEAVDDPKVLRVLLQEAEHHHRACIRELYDLLGIDGSDGEYRFKWVALELADRLRTSPPIEQKDAGDGK